MSTTLFFVRVKNPFKLDRNYVESVHSDALFDKFGELWQIDQVNDSDYEDENIHVYDLSDPQENVRYMQDFNEKSYRQLTLPYFVFGRACEIFFRGYAFFRIFANRNNTSTL